MIRFRPLVFLQAAILALIFANSTAALRPHAVRGHSRTQTRSHRKGSLGSALEDASAHDELATVHAASVTKTSGVTPSAAMAKQQSLRSPSRIIGVVLSATEQIRHIPVGPSSGRDPPLPA